MGGVTVGKDWAEERQDVGFREDEDEGEREG